MEKNEILQKLSELLFEPVSLGGITLPNRVVMAPMTRGFSKDGRPGKNVADYYARRAQNNVGLIITEGTLINHPAAGSNPNWPHMYGPQALQGWSDVVDAVHQTGGKIFSQLWHVGMTRKVGDYPNPSYPPIGPSGLDLSGNVINEEMSVLTIENVIQAYKQAAADAQKCGFDGIEIHGAHGYLIDQFLWSKTNQRSDGYGGDLVSRTRFATEIVKACRQAVGPGFPISFRFSQWKVGDYSAKLAHNGTELEKILTPLVDAGVDMFHCSTRRFWEPEFEGSTLNLAGWAKKVSGKPTITVGSVGLNNEFSSYMRERQGAQIDMTVFEKLLLRLKNHEFDLVAVGRALLEDPSWATKLKENRTDALLPFDPISANRLY